MLKERGGGKGMKKKRDLIKQSIGACRRIWSRKRAAKMMVQFLRNIV